MLSPKCLNYIDIYYTLQTFRVNFYVCGRHFISMNYLFTNGEGYYAYSSRVGRELCLFLNVRTIVGWLSKIPLSITRASSKYPNLNPSKHELEWYPFWCPNDWLAFGWKLAMLKYSHNMNNFNLKIRVFFFFWGLSLVLRVGHGSRCRCLMFSV
jgi:hypothetical protein